MADVKTLPPQALLLQLLRYEPETGLLFWRERPVEMFTPGKYSAERIAASWNRKHAGKLAFIAADGKGYLRGAIFGQRLQAHRVIWKMTTGEDPDQIDHEKRIKTDNRFVEIRNVSQSANQRNTRRRRDNTSGATGVYREKNGTWRASIGSRPITYLGVFPSFEEALRARKEAEVKLGYHENHGA